MLSFIRPPRCQACFSPINTLAFLFLQFLLTALAGLLVFLSSRFPTHAILAILSLLCLHLASGHVFLISMVLCGLCNRGLLVAAR